MLRRFQPAAAMLALALPLAGLAQACITTRQSQAPQPEQREIAKALPVRAWIVQGPPGPALGCAVRLESVDGGERFFYVVRNLYSQDLGLVDALGRAYRYRPHREEAELLGSGPVAEGAARILEQTEPVELIEIPLADLERRLDQELRRRAAQRRPAGPPRE